MQEEETIKILSEYMKGRFDRESSGHDWWHTYRVWRLGKKIAVLERANLYVVELGLLLHDIADYKFNNGNEKIGAEKAEELLEQLSINPEIISSVKDIVENVSFMGANATNRITTLEGQCVQDADRLDAMGAIGIARAFVTGQAFSGKLYDPSIKPKVNMTPEEYKQQYTGERDGTTINHFYEKLLLLKDRMNTETGKRMAQERHIFMEQYLDRFFKEWKGEL